MDVGHRAKPLCTRSIALVFDFRLAMCVEIKEIKVHEMRKTLECSYTNVWHSKTNHFKERPNFLG